MLLNLDIENLININISKPGKTYKNFIKENENKKKNEINKKQKEFEILAPNRTLIIHLKDLLIKVPDGLKIMDT